jgi:hypothetical protein
MKTSELQGAALDWAVGKCEGLSHWLHGRVHYLTDWAQAGPIIERERIDIWWDGDWVAAMCRPGTTLAEFDRAEEHGPTPLVAAMRAFVAAYHGDEGTVPEELIK